jgi:Cu+-exporting ATPase
VAVAVRSRFAGVIAVGDSVATSSADAVLALRNMGIHVLMVTGDNSSAAAAVAQLVAVDEVRAEVLPAGKVDVISELQTAGRVVAMVGDGVNDAAALAAADLGIAMGSGTDVAREASDITIMRDDLGAVVDALRLSRRTSWTIRTNLVWAFGYNVAAIPLAMSGLLTPIVASAAMALSSICVVLNSLRLSAFRR